MRLRLTLWYGGAFLALGATLLVVNYALVDAAFPRDRDELRAEVAGRLRFDPAAFRPGFRVGPGLIDADRPEIADLIDSTGAEIEASVLSTVLWRSGVALASIGAASILVGWFVAGRLLRPIRRITQAARRITDENLHERVALGGPSDELRELADQFDTMLERLERSFATQRDFVADASHELRTPLTIIRTELDVTLGQQHPSEAELRESRRVVGDAVTRAEELIDRLLTLAQADAGMIVTEDVDLAAIAQSVLSEHQTEIHERGLDVTARLAPVAVRGASVLLARLVDNLVRNAVQHNVPAGTLSISTEIVDQTARLQVTNSGRQISAELVDGLFDRFRRIDDSRSRATGGIGLGLAIVRAIVEAHDGQVRASPLDAGGLQILVEFPAFARTEQSVASPSASVEGLTRV